MRTYSKYKTKYYLDPALEKQAVALINSMGNRYVLEGAIDIGDNDCRIWFRDIINQSFGCKVMPIIRDGNYHNYLDASEIIKDPKDTINDDKFEVIKTF